MTHKKDKIITINADGLYCLGTTQTTNNTQIKITKSNTNERSNERERWRKKWYESRKRWDNNIRILIKQANKRIADTFNFEYKCKELPSVVMKAYTALNLYPHRARTNITPTLIKLRRRKDNTTTTENTEKKKPNICVRACVCVTRMGTQWEWHRQGRNAVKAITFDDSSKKYAMTK